MDSSFQKIGLDTTDVEQALERLAQSFTKHTLSVKDMALQYVEFNQQGKATKAGFTETVAGAIEIEGVLKNGKNGWEAYVKSIAEAPEALKKAKDAMSETRQISAGSASENFIDRLMPNMANLKAGLLDTIRSAQSELTAALAGGTGSVADNRKIATDIFDSLQKGIVSSETGIRDKIQGALLNVLKTAERVNAELAKSSTPAKPTAPITSQDLATLRTNLSQIFPEVKGATLQSVLAYNNALNTLFATAAKGTLNFQQLSELISNVQKTPTKDFSNGSEELGKLQSQIQRVIVSYNSMKDAASAAADDKSSKSLLLTFDQIIRLVEVTTIRRFFRDILQGMQDAIGTAVDLQIQIASIQALAKNNGIGFSSLAGQIREFSEAAARPQADVAAAILTGFQSGIIKTQADLRIMNEVIRFTTATVSELTVGMTLLATTLNAFRIGNTEADRVNNQFFETLRNGRLSVQELNSVMNSMASNGAAAGVRLEEVLGLVQNLSRSMSASSAGSTTTSIISAITQPSSELSRVFRQWGFDTGQMALQVLGLTGVLQRLFSEIQSGNPQVQGVATQFRTFQNVLRDQGGLDRLGTDITAIANAGAEPLNRAFESIGLTAGEKFKLELEKVKNYFVTDFAHSFLEGVEKLTQPWGGLSKVIKDAASAVVEMVNYLLAFAGTINSAVAYVNSFGVSIGTLVKVFILYKATVYAVTAVQSALAIQQTITAAAALANGVTIDGVTAAMIRATIYTRLWSIALSAIPLVGIAVAIAGVTGQLSAITNHFDAQANALRAATTEIQRNSDSIRTVEERNNREQLINQQQRLTATAQAWGAVYQDLRAQSERLLEEQRIAVTRSIENVKIASTGVMEEINHTIREIGRQVSQARSEIDKSLKLQLSFDDRDASSGFQRALAAIRTTIGQVTPLQRPNTDNIRTSADQQRADQEFARYAQQYQAEQIRHQYQQEQFQQEQQLIQQRISSLRQEANLLNVSNENETIEQAAARMESARRKLAEVRTLTEQLFALTNNNNRANAEYQGRIGGGSGLQIQRYSVDLQGLQTQLQALTAEEGRAEAAFRSRMAAASEANRVRLRQEEANREAIRLSVRGIEDFRVSDNNGNLLTRFANPATGMANFRTEFDRLMANMREATTRAGISPESTLALATALMNQRAALEAQIERQITNNRIAEAQRGNQAILRENEEMQRQAAALRERGQTTLREVPGRAAQSLTELLAMFNNASNVIGGIPVAGDMRLLGGVSPTMRNTQIIGRRQVDDAREALQAFQAAQGTDREAAAFERLNTAARALGQTYRDLVNMAGNNTLPGTNITGFQAGRQPTGIEQAVEHLRNGQADITEANRLFNVINTNIQSMQRQLLQLPANLQEAALNMNNLGLAAGNQIANIQNLARAAHDLADALGRLRGAPGIAPIVIPDVAPRAGFAAGGLVGGRFNSQGPDTRVAALRDGEFVVNAVSTQTFYPQLVAMNAGTVPAFSEGGLVSESNVSIGDIHVHESKNADLTARTVLAEIRRELRRGNGRL